MNYPVYAKAVRKRGNIPGTGLSILSKENENRPVKDGTCVKVDVVKKSADDPWEEVNETWDEGEVMSMTTDAKAVAAIIREKQDQIKRLISQMYNRFPQEANAVLSLYGIEYSDEVRLSAIKEGAPISAPKSVSDAGAKVDDKTEKVSKPATTKANKPATTKANKTEVPEETVTVDEADEI